MLHESGLETVHLLQQFSLSIATVLREAHGAVVSQENVDEFAGHVADVLRSADARALLSSAALLDARAWSADGLMDRVVELYLRLSRESAPEPMGRARDPVLTEH